MPRVTTQATRTERNCGKCGDLIPRGSNYRKWAFFRQRTPHVRCLKPTCAPRPSELTQSLLATIYGAQEALEDSLVDDFTPEVVESGLQDLIDACEEVAGQYEEAAEPFNNEGEHQERAEAVQDFQSEVESVEWDDHPDEEFEPTPGLDAEEATQEREEYAEAWTTWRETVRENIGALDCAA
jgi:hypothetical protein